MLNCSISSHQNQDGYAAWNPEWLHDTESIYGIACKLATANNFSIADALEHLTAGVGAGNAHAYRTWTSFDAGTLVRRLGQPYIRVQTSLPNWFYQTSGSLDDFYYRALRFCPQCLQIGFHSVVHQSRQVERCPAHGTVLLSACPTCHELINPFIGKPWYCAACDKPLITFCGFDWIKLFKQAPECSHEPGWTQIPQQTALLTARCSRTSAGFPDRNDARYGYARISAKESRLFVDDVFYWKRNARKLGLWYFQEQQAIMRSALRRHLNCTLHDDIAKTLPGMPGRCIAASGQQVASELIWQTANALIWPRFNRNSLTNIELHLFQRLVDRPSGRVLADKPAEIVVRAMVQSIVAHAVRGCSQNRDQFRFGGHFDIDGLCNADAVEWAADEKEFVLRAPRPSYAFPRLAKLANQYCRFRFAQR